MGCCLIICYLFLLQMDRGTQATAPTSVDSDWTTVYEGSDAHCMVCASEDEFGHSFCAIFLVYRTFYHPPYCSESKVGPFRYPSLHTAMQDIVSIEQFQAVQAGDLVDSGNFAF